MRKLLTLLTSIALAGRPGPQRPISPMLTLLTSIALAGLIGCERPAGDSDDAGGGETPADTDRDTKQKENGPSGGGSAGVKQPDNGAKADGSAGNKADADAPAGSAAKETGDRYGLKVGDPAPEVTVRTANAAPFNLAEAYAARPTMVIFYRGGWCPFCNEHLKDVAKIRDDLNEAGVQILAISPDRPVELKKTLAEHDLPYQLLSDSDMKAAEAFEIAFQVDASTLTRYEEYGIDLEEASGRDHHKLPVPSVFIVDTDGVIRFAHSNPDYKVRLSQQQMLAAAEVAP